jgi:hypothetical protein
MGFMTMQCQCGCGKKVQRGSKYFLQQGQGLNFGVEIIDLFDQRYQSHLIDLTFGTELTVNANKLKQLRSRCHQMSQQMLTIAHEGPGGMSVTRALIEEMNLFIVQLICVIQKVDPSEITRLNALARMSRSQKLLYPSVHRRVNP